MLTLLLIQDTLLNAYNNLRKKDKETRVIIENDKTTIICKSHIVEIKKREKPQRLYLVSSIDDPQ